MNILKTFVSKENFKYLIMEKEGFNEKIVNDKSKELNLKLDDKNSYYWNHAYSYYKFLYKDCDPPPVYFFTKIVNKKGNKS